MNDYLILRLAGVMQAWGAHTYEDYRPSHIFPTRSGVVGLLGACLGIDRSDIDAQQNLSASFIFAARYDIREHHIVKINDFHTVKDAPKVSGGQRKNAIISVREYLCDAQFTIAMEFHDNAVYSMEKVRNAVLKPVYTPVLGRRSCPLGMPLYLDIKKGGGFLEVLRSIEPFDGKIYSEIQEGSPNKMVIRDVPVFVRHRQFNTRNVYIHASGGSHVS